MRRRCAFSFCLYLENTMLMFLQSSIENRAEYTAGDDFTDSYSQHRDRDREADSVSITQDKRDNQRIGKNGRQNGEVSTFLTKKISEICAKQGCKTAEYNIRKYASANDVSDDTADE